MLPAKERIAAELRRAKTIWKVLVNNHKSDEARVSEALSCYKSFLEENKSLLLSSFESIDTDLDLIEKKLNYYYELSGSREKRILLNDAYVGLVFNLSESIDELKSKMEEEAITASEQVVLN